jgi:hypothetical protein
MDTIGNKKLQGQQDKKGKTRSKDQHHKFFRFGKQLDDDSDTST